MIFLANLLSKSPVREAAPDAFVPSMSKDPEFIQRRKADVFSDFVCKLKRRNEELVKGGRLVFGVFGELKQAESMFLLVDDTIKTCIRIGIVKESYNERGIIPHFWE